MKLRNKKTGEIIDLDIANIKAQFGMLSVIPEPAVLSSPEYVYTSLAELNADWEDVPEELKEDGLDHIITLIEAYSSCDDEYYPKEIVEKLKAWKRLKDKGFRFDGWTIDDGLRISICTNTDSDGIYDTRKEEKKDLDICFGGEE